MMKSPPSASLVSRRLRRARALHWLAHWGVLGIFAVGVLDFSVIPLPLPNSTDLFLLWLTARGGNPWVLAAGALAGSLVGGYTTWHIGAQGGRAALRRYASARWLQPVSAWVVRHPHLTGLLCPFLPPPVPMAPLVLASGALGVARRRFFLMLGAGLSLRYALIAWLGVRYGRLVVHLWARVLRKGSGPLLWSVAAVLLIAAGCGAWRTFARGRMRGDCPAKEIVPAAD